MIAAVVPGGVILDLQTIRPPPRVEREGRLVCELDASIFFARADANDLVMMTAIRDGALAIEAEEQLDVLERWSSGAAFVTDYPSRSRKIPAAMVPALSAIDAECVIREVCRTRRLRRLDQGAIVATQRG